MKSMLAVSITALGSGMLYCFMGLPSRSTSQAQPMPSANAEGTAMLARVPVAFVPNLGQWDQRVRYRARVGGMTVFLEEKGWSFTVVEKGESTRGAAVRMEFLGAGEPVLAAEEQLPGRHNYFLGNDPAKWCSDVPLYRSVRYRGVGSGIDVRAREQGGHFEYDLLLDPRADLSAVEIGVQGVARMRIDQDGALVLETCVGPVKMPVPVSWEEGPDGEKRQVVCRYELRGGDRFGFAVDERRAGWALVVDPGLVYSTFLGGAVWDYAVALALDAQSAATVAGYTASPNFPTTPGSFDTTFNGGSLDAFVTRLSPTGSSLVYSTFLGGTGTDSAHALALDAQGAATVAGYSLSTDFPTTPGSFDTTHNGGGHFDAFVTRLSPTGASLVYSTFLGGAGYDSAAALALDAQGAATVAGYTLSTDFPTTVGSFDTTYNGGINDAFVTRLSPTGASLVYSTFLGGTGDDQASALALDAQGAATVAGFTLSTDFPTTPGSFDTTYNLFRDAFVTRLSPTGSSLVYSTFLGGTGDDRASALALGAQGAATVAGFTFSTDFPTTPGSFDTTSNSRSDAFVTRLSPTGASLVYSTFLGGTGDDQASALALDAQGAATVAGFTLSTDFPTTPGSFDTTYNLFRDAFVTRLSPTGSSLVYSTFLGGTGEDQAYALVLDSQGAATVAGWTTLLPDFPTTPGSFDTTYNGGGDAFITRLDLLPTGVTAFGRSSPGCTGPLATYVTSLPRVGNATFAITCGNAPPSAPGLLVLAGAGLTTPIPIIGIDLWLNPTSAFFVPMGATSDARGACEFALPIPNNTSAVGQKLNTQFIWVGPTAPPPCPPFGLSASHALEITFQT